MPISITNGSLKYATPVGLGANAFTIEGWFYLDDVATQQYLVHLHTSGDASFYTIFQITAAGKINILVGGSGSGISTTTLSAKRWYHLVWTCSNESTTPATNAVYIDGVAESMSASTVGVGVHTGSVCVSGRANDALRRIVRGTAHRVRIYKNTVTAGQVAAAYVNPMGSDDLATVLASDLVFQTDFDTTKNDTKNGVTPTQSGTANLTEPYPANIPGLAFWGIYYPSGCTLTGDRVSALLDASGNANDAIEVGIAGPELYSPGDLNTLSMWPQGSTKYLQQAASGGLVVDSQAFSFVRFGNTDKLGLGVRQVVIHAGDPATTGAVEFEIDTTGRLIVDVGGGSSPTPSAYMTVCNPRMFGVVCSSSNATIYNDLVTTAKGSALASGTSTGFRIGAKTGAIIGSGNAADRPFNGCVWADLLYQRALSAAEMALLFTYGQSVIGYSYVTATRSITMEGTSTFDGYGVVPNGNIAVQMASALPSSWIFNFANSSENRAHFNSQYSAQTGAAATLAGFAKVNRIFLLQPFGNDWSDTGTPTLATIEADYATLLASVNTDYGTVYAMYPQPRTDGGAETWSDADDEAREADLLTFMTWLQGQSVTVASRPTVLTPTGASAAALQAVTTNLGLYQNDETHLTASGLSLVGSGISDTINGTQRGWSPGTGSLLLLLD